MLSRVQSALCQPIESAVLADTSGARLTYILGPSCEGRVRSNRIVYASTESVNVVVLPKRETGLNRLNPQDCADAARWRQRRARARYRMIVCIDPAEDDDIGDFLMVYRRTEPWACWGVARRDAAVLLWRCADGVDIGTFATVAEALGALERDGFR